MWKPKEKIIAIITARGGSKRIPRKNLRPFLGQPIIKYSIEAALQAGCFDEIMVSTDDQEIEQVAIASGAKVPFFRSAKNSGDFATTADVIEEVISEYAKAGKNFDFICCLYPTAPFVTGEKLKKAMDLLCKSNVDAVVPVVRFSFPIQRAFKIEQGRLTMVWPENLNVRSQDLPPTYHDSGQFYCLNNKSFLAQKKLFAFNTMPFEIQESEVQDIDNEEDWKMAEIKYGIYLKK